VASSRWSCSPTRRVLGKSRGMSEDWVLDIYRSEHE
jgi:hypothetical protein